MMARRQGKGKQKSSRTAAKTADTSGPPDAARAARVAGMPHLVLLVMLGAQTMILELAVPRLLAPAFGNTLFCWTAIIAVVLVALAVGYQVGGALSLRPNVPRLLVVLAVAAALSVVGVAAIGASVVEALSGLDMMIGPLVAAAVLAAIPAGLGAAVVPLVVATRVQTAGQASGQCYAWSTVGSVVGVLATGYVLLPLLGIAGSLLLGAGLVLIAIAICGRPAPAAIGLVVTGLVAISGQADSTSYLNIPGTTVLVDRSNGYHRIRVVEGGGETPARLLYLDSTVEGGVQLGSTLPVSPYQQSVFKIADEVPKLRRSLFLGGGTFSMPRALAARFPDAVVEAVEIDPDVVKIARQYFELGDRVKVHVGDARRVLAHGSEDFDLIVNDAFHGLRHIPFHLLTSEFHRCASERLTVDGVYAVNVVGHEQEGLLLQSVTHTLTQDFPHVRRLVRPAEDEGPANVWLVASRRPLTIGDAVTDEMPDGRTLTDNNAPVEALVAWDLWQGP